MFSWINCSDTLYSVARVAGTAFIVYMGVQVVCGSQTNTTGAQCWNADVSETLSMAALPAQSGLRPCYKELQL